MKINAPQGLRAIGSQLVHGSMTIGSSSDLTNIVRSAISKTSLHGLVSNSFSSINFGSTSHGIQGLLQNELNTITRSITSEIDHTLTGTLNSIESGVESAINAQLAPFTNTIRTIITDVNQATSLVNHVEQEFSSISTSLSRLLANPANGYTSPLHVPGFNSDAFSSLSSVLSAGTSLLSGIGGIASAAQTLTHKIHIGEGMIGLGADQPQSIVMGGGAISVKSLLGTVGIGGGSLTVGGLGGINTIKMFAGALSIGGMSLSGLGLSLGGMSLGSGGLSIPNGGSVSVGGTTLGSFNTLTDVPSPTFTINLTGDITGNAAAVFSGLSSNLTFNIPTTLSAGSFPIETIFDGGGQLIITGVKGDIRVIEDCVIDDVMLLGDQIGSIVVDIWRTPYSSFDGGITHPVVADSITGSAPATITGSTKSTDSTLTGWTTTLNAGDILRFNVNSVTNFQRVTIALKAHRA